MQDLDLKIKHYLLFLVALLLGGAIGFVSNYDTAKYSHYPKFDQQEMLAKLPMGVVKEGSQKCRITVAGVFLRTEPSNLTGANIMALPQGLAVEYLQTVDGKDKNANHAVAAYDLSISEWFHPTVKVKKGTQMTIQDVRNGKYLVSFLANGKSYTKVVQMEHVTRAYVGAWQKVKYDNQVGYIQAAQASAPKYL